MRRSSYSVVNKSETKQFLDVQREYIKKDIHTFDNNAKKKRGTRKSTSFHHRKEVESKGHPLFSQNIFDSDSNNSLAQSLRRYLATSYLGVFLDILSSITSLFSCVLYVIQSYDEESLTEVLATIELSFTIYFLYEYLLRWYISLNRCGYLIETNSIIDLLTIAPTFIEFAVSGILEESDIDFGTLSYFRIVRIARISRLMRIRKLVSYLNTEYSKAVADFVIMLLSGLFIFSGIIMQVENIFRVEQADAPFLEFHDVIYFLVVTLTTVGYGDISPLGTPGRMIISVFVLGWAYYLPKTTNTLISLSTQVSYYSTCRYVSNPYIRHVVLCGAIRYSTLENYLTEFFHDDHVGYSGLLIEYHIVILSEKLPSKDIEILLSQKLYKQRVKFLQGHPLKTDDLDRAQVHLASTIFIMTQDDQSHGKTQDTKTLLIAMTIKRFCVEHKFDEVPICFQTVEDSDDTQIQRLFGVQSTTSHLRILCVNEIRMSIIARAIDCPGLSSLLQNLLVSTGDCSLTASTDLTEADNVEIKSTLKHYSKGTEYEIYFSELSTCFLGLRFIEVAQIVYESLNILLIGLLEDDNIVLNPGNMKLVKRSQSSSLLKGILLAEDTKEADLFNIDVTPFGGDQEGLLGTRISGLGRATDILLSLKKMKNKKVEPIQAEVNPKEEKLLEEIDENRAELAKRIAKLQQITLTRTERKKYQEPLNAFAAKLSTLELSTFNKNDNRKRRSLIEENDVILKDHFIISGTYIDALKLLKLLRNTTLLPILFIFAKSLTQDNLLNLLTFSNVFYLYGNIIDPEVLSFCSLSSCKMICLLNNSNLSKPRNENLNTCSFLLTSVLRKLKCNIDILIEVDAQTYLLAQDLSIYKELDIQSMTDVESVHKQLKQNDNIELYISSFSDRLLWQAFYNPSLIKLMKALLFTSKQSKATTESSSKFYKRIELISLPTEAIGKSVKSLFSSLVLEQQLLIAVKRDSLAITCPSPSLLLLSSDKLFILNTTPLPD